MTGVAVVQPSTDIHQFQRGVYGRDRDAAVGKSTNRDCPVGRSVHFFYVRCRGKGCGQASRAACILHVERGGPGNVAANTSPPSAATLDAMNPPAEKPTAKMALASTEVLASISATTDFSWATSSGGVPE